MYKNSNGSHRQSEKMFYHVMNVSPIPHALNDEDQNIIYLNPAFINIFGYDLNDIPVLADWWSKAYPDKEYRQWVADTWQHRFEQAKQTGNPFVPIELNITCKNGLIRTVLANAASLADTYQGIHLVILYDITDRKTAEENARISDEKYRLAMEVTQEGLWDWDVTTGSVYFSPGWQRILEVDRVEKHYSFWENRIFNEDKGRILGSLNAHLSGETEIWQEEHRLKKSNGEIVWVYGRGQVVKRDEEGNPLRMIGTMTDISEQKENEDLIWHQANYDALTSLPNRKLFHDLLDEQIHRAQRDQKHLWIMFLDIDGFKEINETYGHQKGDKLLVMVSERIQSELRRADLVARLGGDEFVVILSNISDIGTVDRIASNLINSMNKVFQFENIEIHITMSIGIANYPDDSEDAADLLKFADQSKFAAKKKGKNTYSYFTPELQYGSLIRIQIASDIRKALENDEFQLYYQPIVNMDDGSVHKAEALIRWHHPEKGFISPAGFIPIAEEIGLICEIGSWVFKNAFKQFNVWQPLLKNNFQLSINMSPLQLESKDNKHHNWINELNKPLPSGNNIVIEITEGLLVKDEPIVNKRLLQYRDLGIQVAIDDFGTGYSSLSYLKEFDIDYLKIDQSFIRNLKPGSREESLSEAIVVMAHKLDLKVIAEGIETQEQWDLLKTMGCDYGQGYLFAKPLPAHEFEQMLIAS